MLYMFPYSLIDLYKYVDVFIYMDSQNSVTTPINSYQQFTACYIDQNWKSYNVR